MKDKISKFVKSTKSYVVKHSPEILTGIGVAGMITTVVLAVSETPKAMRLLEEAEEEKGSELTVVEKVKVAWKPYIPAVVTGLASVSCIVGGTRVNTRRNAALATAYAISERSLLTYRDKVIETIGEKKEKEIREKVAQDAVDKKPTSTSQVIITSKGNTLCMDAISGRYFRSDIDVIRKAEIKINKEILSQNYISLTEFYHMIGLEAIPSSDDLGWNVDDGYVELEFSSCLAENDEPCLVVGYNVAPKYKYDRFM